MTTTEYINKISCGDCIDLLKQLDANSVDCVITDPPYNVDYGNKNKAMQKMFDDNRKDVIQRDAFFNDLGFDKYTELATQLFRICKDKSHIYICCADRQLNDWISTMEQTGFKYSGYLIWLKNRQTVDLTVGLKYAMKTEHVLFFRKGARKLNVLGLNNVFAVDCATKMRHPTQKPIKLFREFINNSTNEHDLVLDPFMGSGTTAVACQQLNRHYIGFELNQDQCNIANDRLKQKPITNNLEQYKNGDE
jgi:site-specific DNA-methyltransferase (adenine-specific)